MRCEQHKEVAAQITTPKGPLCAWCEVQRLRLEVSRVTGLLTEQEARSAKLELDLKASQRMLAGEIGERVKVSNALRELQAAEARQEALAR